MNVAFLLDADNLSSASDVDQVFRHFRKLGSTVSVRRAYGGHEKLSGMKDVLKQHAVRSFVNQGKGTTDAALVIDAMDLLHHGSLPQTVAIGSSDADFAPLAVRLREAGLRVVCFALRDKADAEALALVYDEVIYLDGSGRQEQPPALASEPRRAPAVRKAAARAPVAKAVAAPKAAGKAVTGEAERDKIFWAVPALLGGEPVPLNEVTKQLRDAGVLGKSAKSTTLLRRHARDFKLTPEANPSHVQWTGRTRN